MSLPQKDLLELFSGTEKDKNEEKAEVENDDDENEEEKYYQRWLKKVPCIENFEKSVYFDQTDEFFGI